MSSRQGTTRATERSNAQKNLVWKRNTGGQCGWNKVNERRGTR